MKNIWKKLSVQFLRYAIELFGSMCTGEAWRHLCTLHFYPEYIDLPGVCIQKFVMINLILQLSLYFSMRHTIDARNIEIWV